jgi:uncharacterized membrane protein YhaH (DUF805 family)
MSFTAAIRSCLSQYVGFQGRAMRSEYWYFALFYFLAYLVIAVVLGTIGAIIGTQILRALAIVVFELAMLLPLLAVGVRRLHDLDKSGWWLCLGFIPLVGGIILLVWFCMPGTRGPNRFGGGSGTSFTSTGPMPMPVGFN